MMALKEMAFMAGYSDSNLGDQVDDYHLTSGYFYLLAGGAISWSACKQRTVAQNTTEAENMAMSEAASVWKFSTEN
jgi:hypothetical protein